MIPTDYPIRAAGTGLKIRSVGAVCAASFLLLSPLFVHAQSATPAGASEGEKMERQMWADFKAKDWEAVERRIADGFQSIHPDGPRDRAGEITLIKNLNLGEFTLSNFKSTVNGDNIVVTYMIAVKETIDQERLATKTTPRLSVWKKGTHGWQWICHANLNPIPQR
ncbi:MAG TPA: nuclear transport factor 2 family protein [Candidatus Acidoferrum sp.]|jgi:hypothetical protein|nr:nuclear transport factor 2 family protein [Candidatus Acidoferrum sp.]